SVVIDRPIDEVFEFVSNPDNDSQWQSGVLESSQTSEGPMGVGATSREVRQFLGRRIESTVEITEYEPNKKIGFKSTSGPIPFKATYIFEPVEGGTELSAVGEAEPGGFFKMAEPIAMRMFEREMKGNFANLKDILEAQA
ncbi:MAG: hypothetical protein GTN71_01985, partial [Anaerolineae bacterium]|nr:hypothetical protein [Anaerolineae bacterium]